MGIVKMTFTSKVRHKNIDSNTIFILTMLHVHDKYRLPTTAFKQH